MIKMVISLFITFYSLSALAESALPAGSLAARTKSLSKWVKLSRERIQGSTAKITDHKIEIHFTQKGLRFDLPLRPDLFKRAGAKIEPMKLSSHDESAQELIEYYDNEESFIADYLQGMSTEEKKAFLDEREKSASFIESKRKYLGQRLDKHEKRAESLRKNIETIYQEYDSMTFSEKERVNEMRRRVMSGLSRFLMKQFKPGVYQVGQSSLDAVEEGGADDIRIPSLKEKWLLKILESFNVQLFSLGKRILSTNEYGWVAFGAPVFMIPKFGHMYVVSLHVGYNTSNDRMYIRVSTSDQKAKVVGGFTFGFLPSFLGFYAATINTHENTQIFNDVTTYNPPSVPAVGFMGGDYAQISGFMPGLPVGGMIIPTTIPPYPLSEFMFFTTIGKIKMHAVGSFAVKKLSIYSKSGKGPKIAQEISEMPEAKKKSILQGILGMAQFWKKKECDLLLTPEVQTQTVTIKN